MKKSIIKIVFILLFVIIIYIRSRFPEFTTDNQICIQNEWKQSKTLKGTQDYGDKYLISFGNEKQYFKWLSLPKLNGSIGEIMIIVSSTSDNYARRNVLRKTWMNSSKIIQSGKMSVLFLVGVSLSDSNVEKMVMEEANLYGDMIVVDMIDTYFHLIYKSISLLLYAVSKTPSTYQLIGKIDEDVIFHPDRIEFLINNKIVNTSAIEVYGHHVTAGGIVHRGIQKEKSWFVSREAFGCPKYPAYLSGPFYFMTRIAAQKILNATKHRNTLQMEDVFITGILADDAGVTKKGIPMMYMIPESMSDDENTDYLAWHTLKTNRQYLEYYKKRVLPSSETEIGIRG